MKIVVGKRLKDARLFCGFGQLDVEVVTGISQSVLSKIERGHRLPKVDQLVLLCDLYCLNLNEVVRSEQDAN